MKRFDAPLYNAIKKYASTNPKRFHMPGHKGVGGDVLKSAKFDVTELDFSGDLLKREGVVYQSEIKFRDTYGVDDAFIFTTGATGGLYSALYVVKRVTDKLILSKNTHKSVFNAMSVLGIEPCFIEVDYRDGLPLPVSVDDIKKAIIDYPDAGAVLVTTPDYYGRVCDCREIKAIIGDRLLIADGAHGAHFVFANLSNRAERYADIAVLSMHKTLPCYTGSAIVTCKGYLSDDLSRGRILFHTTSPQYLAMVSMDIARAKLTANNGHGYRKIHKKLQKLDFNKLDNYDYTRLVLKGGESLNQALKSKGVYAECVCGEWVVLILTPDSIRHLNKVYKIAKKFNSSKRCSQLTPPTLDRTVSFKSVGQASCEKVLISNCVGRVLANEIGLYPPGVPLFFRGEKITNECKEFIELNKNHLFGVDFDCITVLK